MKKFGFIGAGKMAGAIIRGIIDSGSVKKDDIIASEANFEFANLASSNLGIEVIVDNEKVAKNSKIVVIATKPHLVKDILEQIKGVLSKQIIVSIASGVSTKDIEDTIGKHIHVIRIMPNMPAVLKCGMIALCRGKYATLAQIQYLEEIFSTIGKTVIIDEEKMDVFTAAASSGPAFFYKIIDDFAQAAVKLGIDYETALQIIIQTSFGATKMLMETSKTPPELIKEVATPGGCTAVGLNTMAEENLSNILYKILKNTARKSSQLGK